MIELLFLGLCFFGLGDCIEEPVYLESITFNEKYTWGIEQPLQLWGLRCEQYTNGTEFCDDWIELEFSDEPRSRPITYYGNWWG